MNYFDTYILCDTETANWAFKDPLTGVMNRKKKTPHLAATRLVQYSINGGPVAVLDLYTEAGRRGLDVLRLLNQEGCLWVFQNGIYDIPFFKKLGINITRVFDTQVASQILNSGLMMDHDLASLMDRYLGKRPYDAIGRPRVEAEANLIREECAAYEKAFDQWRKDRYNEEEGRRLAGMPEAEIVTDLKTWDAENPVAVPCPTNYMTTPQIDEWVTTALHGMKRSLQCSDWSSPVLSQEQLTYAATDVGPEFDELFLLLCDRITNGGFEKTLDLDMQVLPIVADLADVGVKHHLYKWYDFIEDRTKELAFVEERVARFCDAKMQELHPDYYMVTLRRKKPMAGRAAKVLKDGTVKSPEVPAQVVGDLAAIQPTPELTPSYEVLPHLTALECGDYRVGSVVRAELGLNPGDKFNPGSAVQMRKLVDDLMGVVWDKKHNFDDSIIEDLKTAAKKVGNTDVVTLLTLHQEAQGLRKLITTYGASYWDSADPGGYLHSAFTLAATDTARMSSREPNLQNLPRHMQKLLWCCEVGEVIIKADYSAQELRLLLFLGKQWDMYQKVLEGLDAHSMSASFMLNISYESIVNKVEGKKDKVKPEHEANRTRAKVVTFAPAYFAGPARIGEALGADYKAGKKFYDNYWKVYDKVKVMQEGQVASAVQFGFVTDLCFGRRRFFMPSAADQALLDQGHSREDVLGKWGAPATNYACQSTGGTIIRYAMLKVARWISEHPETGAKLRLPIHDALMVTCKAEYADVVSEALAELMEAAAREAVPGIEIPVDVDIIADHTAPAFFSEEGYAEWKIEQQRLKEGMPRAS